MASSSVIPFQSRHHRRSRVANIAPAEVVRFPKDFLSARADSLDRQAARILARSVALNLQAYLIACSFGLSLLHVPNNGRETCAKENPKSPKLSPDGAA